MSGPDRALRASVGTCLVYVAFVMPWLIDIPSINLALGAFGAMNIASASIGVCPGYLLAKVSTLRAPPPARAEPKGPDEDPAAGAIDDSPRNRLMLCIVLPGVLTASVFAVVLHRFASELVLVEQTAEARAVALLATRDLESGNGAREGTADGTDEAITAGFVGAGGALLLHDRAGRQLGQLSRHPPDARLPVDDLLHAVGTGLNAHRPRETGRWRTSTADLLWVTRRVPGKELWITAIVGSQGYDAALARHLGPRALALVLITLWATLWGAVYNVRRYTRRVAADARELRHRSLHDPLTGLLNRMGLETLLQRHFPTPPTGDHRVAFVVVDLIGFRAINDSFGHELADRLLCEVAERIRTVATGRCEVVRMGGDTFGILCAELDELEHARLAVKRLHEAVDSIYTVGGIQLTLASRSGIAFAPRDTRDGPELVRFADLALSRAKRTRSTHCRYVPDQDTQSVRRLTLMSALRQAIDGDELHLAYQPKISLVDGTLSGVEALARWNHPDYGAVSPEEFVSLAERAGLIDGLTRCVLLGVERQCAVWGTIGLQVPVAVNLSPLNLRDPALPFLIERLVSSGGLGNGLLELELTENAVMEDADLAMRSLCTLRELGVTLSIDDFGSGQSSFAYLRRFPVSNLKIDRQFVMTLAGDTGNSDTLLLRSMIELGHNLGLVVTAEGVEDEIGLQRLQGLGCNYAQGYHIGRPMTADALEGWLETRPDTWSKAA